MKIVRNKRQTATDSNLEDVTVTRNTEDVTVTQKLQDSAELRKILISYDGFTAISRRDRDVAYRLIYDAGVGKSIFSAIKTAFPDLSLDALQSFYTAYRVWKFRLERSMVGEEDDEVSKQNKGTSTVDVAGENCNKCGNKMLAKLTRIDSEILKTLSNEISAELERRINLTKSKEICT